MKVVLIIPAYNEEMSIISVVNEIVEHGYDYIVINDGSTDCTQEVCKQNNIKAVTLSSNLGIGGAVQTGHKYAYANGYDIDIQVDGDGQHDISYLPELIRTIEEGADLAIGSRFFGGVKGFQSSFMRRVGIKWLSGLIRVLYGKRITDPTSGLRASGRKAMELFCRSYPTDYPEPESIAVALNNKLVVKEVPVQMKMRVKGKSSIGASDSVYYMIKVSLALLIELFRRPAARRER